MEKIRHQVDFFKIVAAITLVLIFVFSIICKPNVLTVLPLFVSIVVLFLQSQVNRFCFLIGAFNSAFYALAFFLMGLYSMSAYSLLVSMPITFYTFLLWNKNTANGKTKIRTMSARQRIILFGSMALVWVILFTVFSAMNSSYLVLDNTLSVLGLAASFLCLFRFLEYAILNVISGVVNIVLYSVMMADDMSRIIWLVFSVYSASCSIRAFINMTKLEEKQW